MSGAVFCYVLPDVVCMLSVQFPEQQGFQFQLSDCETRTSTLLSKSLGSLLFGFLLAFNLFIHLPSLIASSSNSTSLRMSVRGVIFLLVPHIFSYSSFIHYPLTRAPKRILLICFFLCPIFLIAYRFL